MLIGSHKMQGMASALTFLEWYHRDGEEFLSHIIWVTGDQTWISFVNVETREHSKQWMHTHSTDKLKKFEQTLSARKLMVYVFWDREGVLIVKFMQQGTTVTLQVHCILRNTKKSVMGQPFRTRHGMQTSSLVLLHDNAHCI
jgi:hypothetical protein